MFGSILLAFLFRLAAGLALAMAGTPHRWVVSGFYRVHLWVLLGLFSLAAVATSTQASSTGFWSAVAGAVLSYIGSVVWLYDRPGLGRLVLGTVGVAGLAGMARHGMPAAACSADQKALALLGFADGLTAALLLGYTTCAMLLGHWYLNTPTMKLEPLKRLVVGTLVAVALRAAVAGTLMGLEAVGPQTHFEWSMTALRWLAGVLGVGIIGVMAWQTLKIPNTQSATGILYVGVILVFLGELAAGFPGIA